MQGWRNTQEDSHITDVESLGPGLELFGVFDGHGGHQVAAWVKDYYVPLLKSLDAFKEGDYKKALEESFIRVDEVIQTPDGNK